MDNYVKVSDLNKIDPNVLTSRKVKIYFDNKWHEAYPCIYYRTETGEDPDWYIMKALIYNGSWEI